MPPSLMRCKHGFCEASRLKQRKCQQNRIAHNAPNAADDVIRKGQVLNQNCVPLMIMLLSQSVICSRILCMSRLLPYANTPNSFAIRDRSMNSCEKRDSADAVVVRNAIDLSSCNLSGLSAGAILNCGSAPYFQHVHLPESAENSQLRRLPAPDYVTGSFRRPVGIFAPTAFA